MDNNSLKKAQLQYDKQEDPIYNSKTIECERCEGTGLIDYEQECPTCEGNGEITFYPSKKKRCEE